jgi:hypothetical protein
MNKAKRKTKKKKPRPSLTITIPVVAGNGWVKFDLNVGGFDIRGCTWHCGKNRLRFPRRRLYPSSSNYWRTVVKPSRAFVAALKGLLRSGQQRTKRDRSPCKLKITDIRNVGRGWYKFQFEVRGVVIKGCRFNPFLGSIQFPITYRLCVKQGQWILDPQFAKRRVVHARGAHVERLRKALYEQAGALLEDDELPQFWFDYIYQELLREKRERRAAQAAMAEQQLGVESGNLEGESNLEPAQAGESFERVILQGGRSQ